MSSKNDVSGTRWEIYKKRVSEKILTTLNKIWSCVHPCTLHIFKRCCFKQDFCPFLLFLVSPQTINTTMCQGKAVLMVWTWSTHFYSNHSVPFIASNVYFSSMIRFCVFLVCGPEVWGVEYSSSHLLQCL